jgi:OTU domain-containing protein 5
MLEDKLKETDWEVTQETIEEQVARESYLQWLMDNQNRAKTHTSVSIQIPPSVSTIKHSGRTESFVGLHTDKCPTNVRPNPPRSE